MLQRHGRSRVFSCGSECAYITFYGRFTVFVTARVMDTELQISCVCLF
jgi:hypothetical protein